MVQRFDMVNVGCAERIWRQAEELTTRGHTVTLVNFPHADRRGSMPRMRPEAPQGVTVLTLDRRAASLPENCRTIAKAAEPMDLIHLWKAYPDAALPVLRTVCKHRKPLHYDWDDLEGGSDGIAQRLTGSPMAGTLLTFWEREILSWADTVTAASHALRERCLKSGFPVERIFPGPVGATAGAPSSRCVDFWKERMAGKRLVVFAGQLEADDFPSSILTSFGRSVREHSDTCLVLVGDGPSRASLETEAHRLGIEEQCQFTGYIPREEVQALLSLATLFLFPLRDDLMSRCKSPLVVVEALSHGIPVVASAVGEVPRMVGDAGILLPTLDPEDWAGALQRLLAEPGRAQELGQKARQRFEEEWTWKRSVDHLEKAYRTALAGGAG